jgi:AcrR family transcriptional regulator
MAEVARAADLSRQGLYLHYAAKDELFCAAITHALATSLSDATALLEDESLGVEARLCAGLDAWLGRYVGVFGTDSSDLGSAVERLAGDEVAEHVAAFRDRVGKVVRSSGLAKAYRPAKLNAKQLAGALCDTAAGLKLKCATRDEFRTRLNLVVRAWCLPLREMP